MIILDTEYNQQTNGGKKPSKPCSSKYKIMNRVHFNREYILKQHNKTIKYTVAGDELINMN